MTVSKYLVVINIYKYKAMNIALIILFFMTIWNVIKLEFYWFNVIEFFCY